ncbi:MAG: hypothetical protein IJZ17_05365, partial [Muribaculaceae bacterium]|nr:hypothetical protein [Muribaculaceae bacterium]
ATVKVYNSDGGEVSSMLTTVDGDGKFTLNFEKEGVYNVKIGGMASYTGQVWDSEIGGYKDKEFEDAASMEIAVRHIDKRLEPFKRTFIRDVTDDDILRLMEIKMGRILKFNSAKADEIIASYKEKIAKINDNLAHIVDYAIKWYLGLKEKYGAA